MVQESLRGHVASSILPMIPPSQETRNIALLPSVQMAWCRWGPEPYSCRPVFRHRFGPMQSVTSAYATILEPRQRGSQAGSDALD
eukprot:2385247-Pyramimonas_sp.AAC.1